MLARSVSLILLMDNYVVIRRTTDVHNIVNKNYYNKIRTNIQLNLVMLNEKKRIFFIVFINST